MRLMTAATAARAFAVSGALAEDPVESAYAFDFVSIDGEPMPFSQFAGQVVLVVNVASFCGNTYQYEGLQTLHDTYKDQGFTVLGIPSSDFGAHDGQEGQEFETEAEIKEFCDMTYGIQFPMTQKYVVKGPEAHPFYAWVKAELGDDELPSWNFHKVLIDRSGQIRAQFAPRLEPTRDLIVEAVEATLTSSDAS